MGKNSHIQNVNVFNQKRPRDLVKLCTFAAKHASSENRSIISTVDFNSIFEEYSQGRLQDTINEYRSELQNIERLLFAMKPSREEKKANKSFIYTTEGIIEKIKNIQQNHSLFFLAESQQTLKILQLFFIRLIFSLRGKIKKLYRTTIF